MIRYALRCENEHEFEAWFKSGSAYDEQRERSVLSCPACGSHQVEKALMAPSIAKGKGEAVGVGQDPLRKMHVMMSAWRKHVEENCEYVGERFAEESRRIHYGEADKRDIYGETTIEEAKELIEEGVEIMPLPGPSKRDAN